MEIAIIAACILPCLVHLCPLVKMTEGSATADSQYSRERATSSFGQAFVVCL